MDWVKFGILSNGGGGGMLEVSLGWRCVTEDIVLGCVKVGNWSVGDMGVGEIELWVIWGDDIGFWGAICRSWVKFPEQTTIYLVPGTVLSNHKHMSTN